MTSGLTLLRALGHRATSTVVILLVAVCAAAAATVGPTYYVAAKTSILQDTFDATNVIGRGYQAVRQGPVQGAVDDLAGSVSGEVDRVMGGAAVSNRVFRPQVLALETGAFFRGLGQNVPLVWRSDVCAHLRFRSGRCPAHAGEVALSTSLAALNHWRLGQRLQPAGRAPLQVVGVYLPPDASGDYWFARGGTYFPAEVPAQQSAPYDALFTDRSTIETLRGNPQGSVVVSRPLDVPRVHPGDVDRLAALDSQLNTSSALGQTAVTTGLSSTVDTVHSSWSALAVPVVVVTAELLVLAWLLLFLVVTDAVDARGPEIALAKLRGFSSRRAMVFGLAEPTALLAVALPVGAVLGWLLTRLLSTVLLRAGTPVSLPGLGWAAAAIACAGGVAAVVAAARTTLSRPVVEQWRRTGRRATDRSWVFDAVVLTGAVAGLVQLAASGSLSSARHSALAMLVPGLLGIAVAVVASRLLPAACRALYPRTRRHGGLGPFLAVRHIARRPGGTRTTMILATAVALVTFSIAAWSVGANNRSRVAAVTVGAPTVLTVAPPVGVDLGAVVDRIDPTGRSASAVEVFDSGTSTLLAVQPQRFAAVANWDAAGVGNPSKLLSSLHPPAPAPVAVDGTRLRMRLDVKKMQPAAALTVDVVAHGASSPTPVDLGTVGGQAGSGALVRSADLAGCPCTLADIQLTAPGGGALRGAVVLRSLEVQQAGAWHPIGGVVDTRHWTDTVDQQVQVGATAGGLRWSFFAPARVPATLAVHDRPDPLPAVVSAGGDPADVTGLDGGALSVGVAGRGASIPSAPDSGVVVDLDYAQRAAFGDVAPATAQVWVDGDVAAVQAGLRQAHVPVVSTRTTSGMTHELRRQGPGLASVLFLADAAAAAVLAALAAVLSLTAAARRRRYEYAALAATGASSRTLYAALAVEQLVVVGFGALTGIVAGLAATALAGRSVPEFVTAPAAALLSYRPSITVLVLALGGGLLLLLAAAALAAAALLRSVSPETLRESPS